MNTIKKHLALPIAIIIIAVLIYKLIFFVIVVPSASMYPTIQIGDRIVTLRIHETSTIERGDVLVFYSDELNETLVKRVMGLPGDRIEITNGIVSVNNQRIEEPYVEYQDNWNGTYVVPEDKFFFLGDARAHSYDSRKWKDPFVSKDNLYGKAVFILMPFERISSLK